MRKYLYYGVLLILTLLLPAQQVRLGRLAPAQVLTVRMENGAYVLETDLKDRGRGKTISQAAMNLRANASGEVLLETVDYLLWSEECLGTLPWFAECLRPGTRIDRITAVPEGADPGQYLKTHLPPYTLQDYRKDPESVREKIIGEGDLRASTG